MVAFILIMFLGAGLFVLDTVMSIFDGRMAHFMLHEMTWWMWVITIGFACATFFNYEEW